MKVQTVLVSRFNVKTVPWLFIFEMYFPGHYCPNSTEYSTQYRCTPGTYNPSTLGTSDSDCLECPGGEYCEGFANVMPTGNFICQIIF